MKRVLIIDADLNFLSAVGREVQNAGYEVLTANSAAAGLAQIQNADLIVVAVELPDQNGFVVCSQIKRNPNTEFIPVFITSSATTTDAFEHHLTLSNHADGYFLKPLDVPALIREIQAIFAEVDASAYANGAQPQQDQDMVDVSDDMNMPQDDDSEVIKALSVDDMSLFSDIDAKDLMGDDPAFDEVDVNSDAAAPAEQPAPAMAQKPPAPKPAPQPAATLPRAMPPRPGLGGLPPRPSVAGLPAAPASPTPSPTLTGMPAAKPAPAAPISSVNPALSGARANMGVIGQKPISAISNVSQTAIPAADIARLNDEITVLKNEITVLKSEIIARDNRITMLQSQCDALNARCQNAESISEALKAESEQALMLKANAEDSLQNMLQQSAQNDQALSDANARNHELQNQIDDLKMHMVKLKSSLDALAAEIG